MIMETVVVCGHSCVVGLKDHIKETLRVDEISPQETSRWLQVTSVAKEVHLIGKRGGITTDLPICLESLTPTTIIVDCGSNDIKNKRDPHRVVEDLIEAGKNMSRATGSPVFFCSALYRYGEEEFNTNVVKFNKLLDKMVKLEPNLFYHFMRGFWATEVSKWSHDGVHPNTPIGRKKYKANMKRVIHLGSHVNRRHAMQLRANRELGSLLASLEGGKPPGSDKPKPPPIIKNAMQLRANRELGSLLASMGGGKPPGSDKPKPPPIIKKPPVQENKGFDMGNMSFSGWGDISENDRDGGGDRDDGPSDRGRSDSRSRQYGGNRDERPNSGRKREGDDGRRGEDNKRPKQDSDDGPQELKRWSDIGVYDDDHDKAWFDAQNAKLAEEYGKGIITVTYLEGQTGRVGYYCELCYAEMNAKKSLELHCGGMKHLKKKNLFDKGKGGGNQDADGDELDQPPTMRGRGRGRGDRDRGIKSRLGERDCGGRGGGDRDWDRHDRGGRGRSRDSDDGRGGGRGGGRRGDDWDRDGGRRGGDDWDRDGRHGGGDDWDRPGRRGADDWDRDGRRGVGDDWDRDGRGGSGGRDFGRNRFDDREDDYDNRGGRGHRDLRNQRGDYGGRDPLSGRRSPNGRSAFDYDHERRPSQDRGRGDQFNEYGAGVPHRRPSPPPAPTISGLPRPPPPVPDNLTTGATGSLLKKMAACSVKTNDDATLATEVIIMLIKPLKDYKQKKGCTNAVHLLDDTAVKMNIMKALDKDKPGAPPPPSAPVGLAIPPAPSVRMAPPPIITPSARIAPPPPSMSYSSQPPVSGYQTSAYQYSGIPPKY